MTQRSSRRVWLLYAPLTVLWGLACGAGFAYVAIYPGAVENYGLPPWPPEASDTVQFYATTGGIVGTVAGIAVVVGVALTRLVGDGLGASRRTSNVIAVTGSAVSALLLGFVLVTSVVDVNKLIFLPVFAGGATALALMIRVQLSCADQIVEV